MAQEVARELALSRRETQVLVAASRGQCIKETAADLGVSVKAVQYFWARIFMKSGCASQLQVLALLLVTQPARANADDRPPTLRICLRWHLQRGWHSAPVSGFGSRSLVVAVAIRALLVAGTLAGAFNFACGKSVNVLYCTPRGMIATCSVTREECVAGFAFANGGFGCTNVVAQPTFTTTACFISSSEPPAAGRACGRYCNEASNLNDPHNPQSSTTAGGT